MFIKYRNPDLGLLLARLALSAIFFGEVWTKTAHLSQVAVFFGHIGLARWMVYFIILVELVAAVVFLLGVLPEWGYVIAVEMSVIIVKLLWAKGVLGYMAELMILTAALTIALSGAGKYSIIKEKTDNDPFASPPIA